jgi:hypothetical protein
MVKKNLIIYAGNVAGIGAKQVVKNILLSLNTTYYKYNYNIQVYLPNHSELINYTNIDWDIIIVKRFDNFILHFYHRFIVLIKDFNSFNKNSILINLGDIPLKYKGTQFLLFHNTNIIDYNKRKLSKYFILNIIFKYNIKYTSKIFVQSPIVKNLLYNSINNIKNIHVLPMPVDKNYIKTFLNVIENTKTDYNLFYPVDYYPHKNFKLISNLTKVTNFKYHYNLLLTINCNQFTINNINTKFNIKFINNISHDRVLEYLNNSFALFYPSIKESYGIPLVEAMVLKKYIICADLPYARWMCEDEAIYFDPFDTISAYNALEIAVEKYKSGHVPNWDKALLKIPTSWEKYTHNFIN